MIPRMDRPRFRVDASTLAHYNRLFDVGLSDEELAAIEPLLASVLGDLARLWDHDVAGVETAVNFRPRPE